MAVSANWVDATMQIPDLLRLAPHVRPVLDRYGLRGCGGAQGPAETLGFFARAHEVPVERLLREVREGLATGPGPSTATESAGLPAQRADAIYRPFFKAGIAVVLTFGAAWGAYLLLRISLTGRFAAAGLHEVNAHGHAQIFGWVGLFVMGFAYQAFPRFKHATLASPRLAWASLGLMLAGLVGRSLGEPLASALPWAGPIAVASAWLEVAAVGLFVWVILATWRAAARVFSLAEGDELLRGYRHVEHDEMGEGTHEDYMALANSLADRLGVSRTVAGLGPLCCHHVHA